jgi:hypothetical protein
MLFTENQLNKPQDKLKQLLAETPGLWRGNQREHGQNSQVGRQSNALRPSIQTSGDLFADQEPIMAREQSPAPTLSTGFSDLDQLLPGGGWPASGLVEIISRHKAIGELQLLMPLLRLRSHQPQSLLWITPPYKLHGPALAESGVNIRNSFVIPAQTRCNHALWSIEKALQSTECGMVLAWQNWLGGRVIRRLQMAACEGKTLGVLFHQRPTPHSPATVQLELSAAPDTDDGYRQIGIRLLRAKGSHRQGEIRLRLPG